MKIITFYQQRDHHELGSIWLGAKGRLEYDTPGMMSIADLYAGREAAFMERFDGAASGYYYTKTTTLGSTARPVQSAQ